MRQYDRCVANAYEYDRCMANTYKYDHCVVDVYGGAVSPEGLYREGLYHDTDFADTVYHTDAIQIYIDLCLARAPCAAYSRIQPYTAVYSRIHTPTADTEERRTAAP